MMLPARRPFAPAGEGECLSGHPQNGGRLLIEHFNFRCSVRAARTVLPRSDSDDPSRAGAVRSPPEIPLVAAAPLGMTRYTWSRRAVAVGGSPRLLTGRSHVRRTSDVGHPTSNDTARSPHPRPLPRVLGRGSGDVANRSFVPTSKPLARAREVGSSDAGNGRRAAADVGRAPHRSRQFHVIRPGSNGEARSSPPGRIRMAKPWRPLILQSRRPTKRWRPGAISFE